MRWRCLSSGLGLCLSAFAQQSVPRVSSLPPSVVGSGGGGIAYEEVPLVEKVALARKATTSTSCSEEARAIIETALKTTRFAFTLPPPDSCAILTHAGEDIVIARGQLQ